MKKFNSFLIILTFILSACASAPQVTITPEATATLPPASPTAEATTTPEPALPSATPEPEHFEPMELSADPDNPAACTYEDVTSGRLASEIKRQAQPFPEGAVNMGWVNERSGASGSDLVPKRGSKGLYQFMSICEIPTDSLNLPGQKMLVASFAVLNKDGSTGVLNYIVKDVNELKLILSDVSSSNGTALGIRITFTPDGIKDDLDKPIGQVATILMQRDSQLLFSSLKTKGNVPKELEKMIAIPAKNG